MKATITTLIIGLIILSGLGASAIQNTENITTEPNQTNPTELDDYTHTVFIEVATAQFCGPCHYWNQNLYSAYSSGDYDFQYVEMVVYAWSWTDILNQDAYNWNNLYGISAYPTSIMDGDYKNIVGGNVNQLPNFLNSCGTRTVADIDATMTITWLGDATMQIDIAITNNEATTYNGYIRAPITEITSRYETAYGDHYHFGFLAYAFNKDISINAGDTYTDSITWNGNDHEDNHGTNFGDITANNIQVTLGIFNDNDGFVDETVAARIETANDPPAAPPITGPSEGIPGETYNFTFTAEDANNDDLYFYIDWGDGNIEDWFGPYASGESFTLNHTWQEKDTYTVRAKAKDTSDAESGWGELDVKIPVSNDITLPLIYQLIQRLIQRFPLLSLLLSMN